jgi:hypothetical protein
MSESKGSSTASSGVGYFGALGIAIAVQISWGLTHSVWYAILHGWLGWFYIIYRCLFLHSY